MKHASKTTKISGTESIVFFGSGPVAAKSLEFLIDRFEIEVVITKAVPKHHPASAPVESLARTHNLPILFANTKAELDKKIADTQFKSRLGIIVDFGVIVSQATIDTFELGIINSHFSLLPRWRGADPISFAIIGGDKKTGVSLMLIEPTLDTGKLLVQKSLAIDPGDTTPSLTNKLVNLSNKLLAEYIPLYLEGAVRPRSQSHPERATYSRKLTKDDGNIDWSRPAEQIERDIRAFIEWPKSRTKLGDNLEVIITKAHSIPSTGAPGFIEVVKEVGTLIIYCGNGYLCIDRLKPVGKNEMRASDFIKGYGSRIGKKVQLLLE